ncbi:hypothetical protein U1Q18_034660 [Sarracenia purpurea var. burkii]
MLPDSQTLSLTHSNGFGSGDLRSPKVGEDRSEVPLLRHSVLSSLSLPHSVSLLRWLARWAIRAARREVGVARHRAVPFIFAPTGFEWLDRVCIARLGVAA